MYFQLQQRVYKNMSVRGMIIKTLRISLMVYQVLCSDTVVLKEDHGRRLTHCEYQTYVNEVAPYFVQFTKTVNSYYSKVTPFTDGGLLFKIGGCSPNTYRVQLTGTVNTPNPDTITWDDTKCDNATQGGGGGTTDSKLSVQRDTTAFYVIGVKIWSCYPESPTNYTDPSRYWFRTMYISITCSSSTIVTATAGSMNHSVSNPNQIFFDFVTHRTMFTTNQTGCFVSDFTLHDQCGAACGYQPFDGPITVVNRTIIYAPEWVPGSYTAYIKGMAKGSASFAYKLVNFNFLCGYVVDYVNQSASFSIEENQGNAFVALASSLFSANPSVNCDTNYIYSVLKAISPREDSTPTKLTLNGTGSLLFNTLNPGYTYVQSSYWVKARIVSGDYKYVEVRITLAPNCNVRFPIPRDFVNPIAFSVSNPYTNATAVNLTSLSPSLLTTPPGCSVTYSALQNNDAPFYSAYSGGKITLSSNIITMTDCVEGGVHLIYVKAYITEAPSNIGYQKLSIACPCENPSAVSTPVSFVKSENSGMQTLTTEASLFINSPYHCPTTSTLLKMTSPEDPSATNVTIVSGIIVLNTTNPTFYNSPYSVWVKRSTLSGQFAYVKLVITLQLDCNTHVLLPLDPVNPLLFSTAYGSLNKTSVQFLTLATQVFTSDFPSGCPVRYDSLHNDDAPVYNAYSGSSLTLANSVISLTDTLTIANYSVVIKGSIGQGAQYNVIAYQRLFLYVQCPNSSSINVGEPNNLHAQRVSWVDPRFTLVVPYLPTQGNMTLNLNTYLNVTTEVRGCAPVSVKAYTSAARTTEATSANYNSYLVAGTSMRSAFGVLIPILNLTYGPSEPQTVYLRYFGLVTKDIEIHFVYCSSLDPLLPQGTNNSVYLHEKPQFETSETLDFTNFLVPYWHTKNWCNPTEVLLSTSNATYIGFDPSIVNKTDLNKVYFNASSPIQVNNLFLLYRPVYQTNQFWVKPINFTVYQNCTGEIFQPINNSLKFRLQKNDKYGIVRVIAQNVSNFFQAQRINPLCQVRDWDLVDLDTKMKMTSGFEVYERTEQQTRSQPMAPLQFNQNNSNSQFGEKQFVFGVRVYLRDVSTRNRSVPHQFVQPINITLGCYALNELDINPISTPLVNSQDFVLSSFIKDEVDKKSGKIFKNYFRLYVNNIRDSTLTLDLNDLMNFSSDYVGCGCDALQSFRDNSYTNLTSDKDALRLVNNPANVNRSSGYMDLTVMVPNNATSSGNQFLYFKASHFNEQTLQSISNTLTVELVSCIDLPSPIAESLQVNLIKNDPDPFIDVTKLFSSSLYKPCLEGDPFNLDTIKIKFFINDDHFSMKPLIIEGVELNETRNVVKINVETATSLNFTVHKNISFPRSSAAILIQVNVTALVITFIEPPPEILKINCTIDENGNKLFKEKKSFTFPKLEVPGEGSLKTFFIGFYPNYVTPEFNLVKQAIVVTVNQTLVAESGTYTLQFIHFTENTEKQAYEFKVEIHFENKTLNNSAITTDQNDTETLTNKTKEAMNQSSQDIKKPLVNQNINKKAREDTSFNASTWTPPLPTKKKTQKEAPPLPIVVKISEIDFNGMIKLQFNQRLVLPPFIDMQSKEEKNDSTLADLRKLIPLKDVDLTQILKVNVKMNSDISAGNVTYNLELIEWTPTFLKVKILFDDPSQISRGEKQDKVEITIVDPNLFISEESGVTLTSFESSKSKSIPRQLPKGVNQEQIQSRAKTLNNVANALVITQIVVQFFFKKGLNRLFLMYYTLQVMVYLQIYDIQLPASAELFNQQFRNLVEFKLADPNAILEFVTGIEGFNWMDYVFGIDRFLGGENRTPHLLDEFGLFIFYGVLLVLVLVICLIISKSKLVQGKLLQKARGLVQRPWKNNLIQTFSVVYIKLAMAYGSQILAWLKSQNDQTLFNRLTSAVLFGALFFYLVLTQIILMRHKHELDTPKTKAEIGNLYPEIRTYDIKSGKLITSNLMYYTVWLSRRLIFVAIPTFLHMFSIFPLQFLMLFQTFYVIYYLDCRPHDTTFRIRLEVINEIIVMVTMYHLMVFSEFNLDVEVQYYAGYSFAGCFAAVFSVNLPPVIWMGIKEFLNRRKKNQKLDQQETKPSFKLPDSIQQRLDVFKLKYSQLKREEATKVQPKQQLGFDLELNDVLSSRRYSPEDDPANMITGMKPGGQRVNSINLKKEEDGESDKVKSEAATKVDQKKKDKKKKDKKKKDKKEKEKKKMQKKKESSQHISILQLQYMNEIKEDIEGEEESDTQGINNIHKRF